MNNENDTVLVTGGAGFIGGNFTRILHEEWPTVNIVVVDKLTYAGNLRNLRSLLDSDRLDFVRADVSNRESMEHVFQNYSIDSVVNFAAESHVDRSIEDPGEFIRSNIGGTFTLLDVGADYDLDPFIQVSTDEVYGSLGSEGQFTPETRLDPSSPYSASKASADLLAQSYLTTYDFPVIIVRCSNNYGPYQYPEKFIPVMIEKTLDGEPLPLYGDGTNVRDWIYVEDFCRGILETLRSGKTGKIYHFGGDCEKQNIEVAKNILEILDRSEDLIEFVEDRPGHDFRYAMDFSQTAEELGWSPQLSFADGLQETIKWFKNNRDWVNAVRNNERSEELWSKTLSPENLGES